MTAIETTRNIVATSALPYANGSIHLGHLVEYLQTDYFVRFQKMRGHSCLYICADDTHGTPVMIRAKQEGVTPEEWIEKSQKEHLEDFGNFQIKFDQYSSTHSPENKKMADRVFKAMEIKGHTSVKLIKQNYCEHDKMFLPDRFVLGTCPSCKSNDQYGDSCDKCGATYAPADLIDPKCSLCEARPVLKDSEHIFFKLGDFQDFLKSWVPEHTREEVSNKLKEWYEGELRDWDISRDEPYFGFEIPGHQGKYFYVWVDAPICYLSTTKIWCDKNGVDFDEFWNRADTEVYHFIGKDIVYFHALFWPAMLKAAELKTPKQINVHGFLTVNGEKMSKSKGTFISARTYLEHLDPIHLRYYYACKLNGIEDIDLNLEDFSQRVNSDLIGKITNLGSRGAQMLNKKLDGVTSEMSTEGRVLVEKAQAKSEEIAELYESLNFARAMVEIREIADMANKYFDEKAPWKMIKEDEVATKKVLTDILNIFRILAVYLKPVLPEYSQKVEKLFLSSPFSWASANEIFENHKIEEYEHLATRVDPKKVELLVTESVHG